MAFTIATTVELSKGSATIIVSKVTIVVIATTTAATVNVVDVGKVWTYFVLGYLDFYCIIGCCCWATVAIKDCIFVIAIAKRTFAVD
jgi:hypothetical protein